MLIAEELFLLLRRDDGKAESATAQNAYGLAAAVITDLVLAERITLSDDRDPRMSVLHHAATGHPVLDAGLARLRERDGKKLSGLVTDRKLALEGTIAASLVRAGVITIEEKRALGLVPARYPMLDPEPERRVRERLRVVLAGGTPSAGDSTLLAILQGLGIAPKVLAEEKGTLGGRELKRRIEEVATEVLAGEVVRKAVQAMNAAIMTAAVLPAIAAGGAAGS
jgi:hypothetical protein